MRDPEDVIKTVAEVAIDDLEAEVARLEAALAAYDGPVAGARCKRCHRSAPNENGCALCNVPELGRRITATLAELDTARERIAMLEAKVNRIAPERDLARAELEELRAEVKAYKFAHGAAEDHLALVIAERDEARAAYLRVEVDRMALAAAHEEIASLRAKIGGYLKTTEADWRTVDDAIAITEPVKPWTPAHDGPEMVLACGCIAPGEIVNTLPRVARCKEHGDQLVAGYIAP